MTSDKEIELPFGGSISETFIPQPEKPFFVGTGARARKTTSIGPRPGDTSGIERCYSLDAARKRQCYREKGHSGMHRNNYGDTWDTSVDYKVPPPNAPF